MLSRFFTRSLLVLTLLIFAGQGAHAAENMARSAALLSITTDDLKQDVSALADDTFEGRESGSRGSRAAGIYIIERLRKCGIGGGGAKGSYYQPFNSYNNILGFVAGSDTEPNAQVIVVGAHYDHVGYGTASNSYGPIGRIHNGADDNASGVAGLLEVAEAVGKMPERPRRSILFAFWDGEEKGLLGSQHWIDHPTVTIERVPMAINVDMIGRMRNARVEIFGARTGHGLRELLCRQNETEQLWLDFNWDVKPDSDHHTFFARGIPFVMMHTGMHNDYHRPSDDADKVNSEGLAQISRFIFNVLVELADAPALTAFRRQSRMESKGDQQFTERGLPPAPGRLGIRWDEVAARDGRIVVAAVTPASAADKAGFRPGDRLLRFGGEDIREVPRLRSRILSAQSPVEAIVERSGEAEPKTLSVQLPGEPIRLGISWRMDNAEPGAVIVNRVTPGSPADLAGVRINDRIYRLNGHSFGTSEDFRKLVAQTSAPLTLELDSAGRLRNVDLPSEPEASPAVETTGPANDSEAR